MADSSIVVNPSAQQFPDASNPALISGRHGDVLVSELHGKRYSKSARGNLFWGSSGVAGVSLLAPGGTTAGFVLYNPANSGVNLEVEQFRIVGASTELDVVAGLGIEGSMQVPSGTLTGATVSQLPLGANLGQTTAAAAAANGKVYKAATIVAMTFIGSIGLTIQATTSPVPVGLVDFDGTLVLAPGMAINFVSTITQGANITVCDVLWSEWKI